MRVKQQLELVPKGISLLLKCILPLSIHFPVVCCGKTLGLTGECDGRYKVRDADSTSSGRGSSGCMLKCMCEQNTFAVLSYFVCATNFAKVGRLSFL